MYPFRVRITDPDLEKYFKILKVNRSVFVDNKSDITKLGHKLRPIRKDIFIGPDRSFTRSCVALPPDLDFDIKPAYGNKKGFDIIFKSLF